MSKASCGFTGRPELLAHVIVWTLSAQGTGVQERRAFPRQWQPSPEGGAGARHVDNVAHVGDDEQLWRLYDAFRPLVHMPLGSVRNQLNGSMQSLTPNSTPLIGSITFHKACTSDLCFKAC